jgi:hypothetical protein
MTRTTPLRRTILQLRQIFLTEASTFTVVSFRSVSLRAEYDASAREVVGCQLDGHLVAHPAHLKLAFFSRLSYWCVMM